MSWSGLSAEHFLQAAEKLRPIILAERDEIEQRRGLSADLFHAMHAAGFFSLWLPHAIGGPELPVTDLVRTIETLSHMDGSVGWCAGVATSYSRLAGYLAPPIAHEIASDGMSVLAGTLAPSGKATFVPGGYRVSGRWSYGSGITHSNWALGSCQIFEHDEPKLRPDGWPEARLMIFPKEDAEVLDTWHVSGLRGTGSHDFRVAELFVPDERSLDAVTPVPVQPGRLYALPLVTVFTISIMGVPLGTARAAIDALMELAERKTPLGSTQLLKNKADFQMEIGRAEAILRSARGFVLEATQALWDAYETGGPTMRDRALVRMAGSHAASASAQVVDMMFNAGGGSSLYEGGRLARCWRDVHAMTQHAGLSPSHFGTSGRVMLGMDPGTLRF